MTARICYNQDKEQKRLTVEGPEVDAIGGRLDTKVRWFVSLFLGGLLCLVAVACFLVTGLYLAKDLSLWILGERTTARVTDAWIEPVGDAQTGELTFRYLIRYQFVTREGQMITRTVTVSPNEWVGVGFGAINRGHDPMDGQHLPVSAPVHQEQKHVPPWTEGGMEKGAPIAVVYFPLYPAHNRLDESPYIPILACAYVPLVLFGVGVWLTGRRLLRSVRCSNLINRLPPWPIHHASP